jgi:hypothetical protein
MINKLKQFSKFLALVLFYHGVLVATTGLIENKVVLSTTTWLALKHFYFLFAVFFAYFGWVKGFHYIIVAASHVNRMVPWTMFNFNKRKLEISLSEVDKLGDNGKEFESYIAALYRAQGLNAKTTTELKEDKDMPEEVLENSGQGEQGVDVIVFLSELQTHENGIEFDALLIQCKQYSGTVSNKAVQEIYGAIPMYSKYFKRKFLPMVITNNYYTASAKDLAASNRVVIVDRDGLGSIIQSASNSLKNAKKY